MKYQILEHKADLKIRAFGKDLKELFFEYAFRYECRPSAGNPKLLSAQAGEIR